MYKLECMIQGHDKLSWECAKIAQDFGHEMSGVMTQHPEFMAWAVNHGLLNIAYESWSDTPNAYRVVFSVLPLTDDNPFDRYPGLDAHVRYHGPRIDADAPVTARGSMPCPAYWSIELGNGDILFSSVCDCRGLDSDDLTNQLSDQFEMLLAQLCRPDWYEQFDSIDYASDRIVQQLEGLDVRRFEAALLWLKYLYDGDDRPACSVIGNAYGACYPDFNRTAQYIVSKPAVNFDSNIQTVHDLQAGQPTTLSQSSESYYRQYNISLGFMAVELEHTVTDDAVPAARGDIAFVVSTKAKLQLFYNGDYLSNSQAKRLSDMLLTLYEYLAGADNWPVNRFPPLPSSQQKALEKLGQGESHALPAQSLDQAFSKQAQYRPDAIALIADDQWVSYSRLDNYANSLAWQFGANIGHEPGQRIVLCLQQGVNMVASILACWKMGAAYIALTPDTPGKRLLAIVEEAEPGLVVTDPELYGWLAGLLQYHPLKLWHFEHDGPVYPTTPVDYPSQSALDQSAYIVYTSGTTGAPKGIEMHHRGALNMIDSTIRSYPICPSDNMIKLASYTFDFSVWEMLAPLAAGATLVIPADNKYRDTSYLVQLMLDHRVTIFGCVTSLLVLLLEEPAMAKCSDLKCVVAGAEPLTPYVKSKFHQLLPDVQLFHGYGPTETAITSVHWRVPQHEGYSKLPIGWPIANTRLMIVDDDLSPVAEGACGELLIGGHGVAKGYVHQPEQTAKRFITLDRQRFFRTSDYVRWLNTGELEFIGRRDHMVKVRGFRIELEAIEHQITALPYIENAVVTALGRDEATSLAAYYVPEKGQKEVAKESLANAVHSQLSQNLPDYMVPAHYIELDYMPLTPGGKIDRRRLPEPVTDREMVWSEDEVEAALQKIWLQLVELPRIATTDHFFGVGGNSLLAIRLTQAINHEFKIDLSVSAIFDSPVLHQLAQKIKACERVDGAKAQINHSPSRLHQALTDPQRRLWYIHQLEPQSALYNIVLGYQFQGHINQRQLETSIQYLIKENEALRTCFGHDAGEPYQTVVEPFSLTLPCHYLAQQQLRDAVDEIVHRPFDITSPPVRFELCRTEHGDHLLIVLHNLIIDGWSMRLLTDRLMTIYRELAHNDYQPNKKPGFVSHYLPYYQTSLQTMQEQRGLDYWLSELKDYQPLALPKDYPRPGRPSTQGQTLWMTWGPDLAQSVHQTATGLGVSEFAVLQAAFAVLLHRYCQQNDVVIGSVVADRYEPELEEVLGFLVNTVVLRSQLRPTDTFDEFVQKVQHKIQKAQQYQHVPFETIVRQLEDGRETAQMPVFQVLFISQNVSSIDEVQFGDVPGQAMAIPKHCAMLDLTVNVSHNSQGIGLEVQFNTDIFAPARIGRLFHNYGCLLDNITKNHGRQLCEIDYLPSQTKQQLLQTFNQAECTQYLNRGMPELWQNALGNYANSIACEDPSRQLTYHELDVLARSYSAAIEQAAANHGPVAIIANPDCRMLAVILACLNTGRPYLLIDPEFPVQRMHYMCQVANAQCVIVNENTQRCVQDSPLSSYPHFDMATVAFDGAPGAFNDAQNLAEQAAYIMFTSGSTGQPKGVKVLQRNLVNLLLAFQKDLEMTPAKTLLSVTAPGFDILGLELLLPLISGGRVYICPQEMGRDPSGLLSIIQTVKPDIMQTTPSRWRILRDFGCRGQFYVPILITGGEKVTPQIAAFLKEHCSRLLNTYGPTETTIWSTYSELTDGNASNNIGRPIANTRCYVLDPYLQPVPIGCQGELYIAGEGVSAGYINNFHKNREHFVTIYLDGIGYERCYKTGDLVHWDEQGELHYHDRQDRQVKIRGHRIELAEISSRLMRHCQISAAHVCARATIDNEYELVAYYVPAPDCRQQLTHQSLEGFLKPYLPRYMLPMYYVELTDLPLNQNGKVDENKLPAPERFDDNTQGTLPNDETERQLLAMWQQHLAVEFNDIHTNFYCLGGHSLLVPQLVWSINQTFDSSMTVRDFIANPTVSEQAQWLAQEEVVTV